MCECARAHKCEIARVSVCECARAYVSMQDPSSVSVHESVLDFTSVSVQEVAHV